MMLLLLNIDILNLSNYNSLFELFAGLSSALIGFSVFRDRVSNKLNLIRDILTASNQFVTQYLQLIEVGKYIPLTKKAKKLMGDIKSDLARIDKKKDVEKLLIENLGLTSYIYCCLSCIYLIVLAALQSDEIFTGMETMRYAATYLFITSLVMLFALLVSFFAAFKYYSFALLIIIISVISIILPDSYRYINMDSSKMVLAGILFMVSSPILLLFIRGRLVPFLLEFRLMNSVRGIKSITKEMEEELKKMLP